jgi:hypothetical protein
MDHPLQIIKLNHLFYVVNTFKGEFRTNGTYDLRVVEVQLENARNSEAVEARVVPKHRYLKRVKSIE